MIVKSFLKMRNNINCRKLKIPTPPFWSDMVGYEKLIWFLKNNGIDKMPGDIVEIGAFLGGGTFKLSKYFWDRKIYAIDIFNLDFDNTKNVFGVKMSDIYKNHLRMTYGQTQHDIYKSVTGDCENITTIWGDSKKISLSMINKIAFAFIDGNHDPEYVENDFYLVWYKIVPGGCVAFHDYGDKIPGLKEKIDELVEIHNGEIFKTHLLVKDKIFFVVKGN